MNLPADAPLCASGKRPFRTEAQALAALSRNRGLRQVNGDEGRRPGVAEASCYQCRACEWWHLASTTGRVRRSQLGNAKNGRRRRS